MLTITALVDDPKTTLAEDSFEYIAPAIQEQASLLKIGNARKPRLQR
jgi:hypothetical protein